MRLAILTLAALLSTAAWAQPTFVTHTTPSITFESFNSGYYGNILGVPTNAFAYNGTGRLFEGQLLVAFDNSRIAGFPYSTDPANGGASEWTTGAGPTAITAPAPFDQAYETAFTDQSTTLPLGIGVVQRTYTSSTAGLEDFAVVELEITNNSGFPEPAAYIGIFSDFDMTAAATADRGSFDAATQTVYTFTTTAGVPQHFGVTLLDGRTASGWNVSTTTTTDIGLFTALSAPGTAANTNADRRNVIGAGPFNLAAGATQRVRFAFVAGDNLADLLVNAAAARGQFPVASTGGPARVETLLSAPAPNPTAGAARLTLAVEQTQDVRVTLVDALGRDVAVAFEGTVAAGTTVPVTVETRTLPAGVYAVRAEGASVRQTQRLVVVR